MLQLARRLTAAALLAAILAMASPAAAASAPRPSSPRAPTVLGPDLLHQIWIWFGAFWSGDTPAPQRLERKLVPVSTSTDSEAVKPRPVDLSRGGMIDPNG